MTAHDRESGTLSDAAKRRLLNCLAHGVSIQNACRRFNVTGDYIRALLRDARGEAQPRQARSA